MSRRLAAAALSTLALASTTAAQTVIQVPGAGDGLDDTATLLDAFDQAETVGGSIGGPIEIAFDPGVYDFFVDDGVNPVAPAKFVLDGVDDVTLSGNGAELRFHSFNPSAGYGEPGVYMNELLVFRECDRLLVRDLDTSMERPAYSSGKVVAGPTGCGGSTVEVVIKMDDDFRDLDDDTWIDMFLNYDYSSGFPYGGTRVQLKGDRSRYGFEVLQPPSGGVMPGDPFKVRISTNALNGSGDPEPLFDELCGLSHGTGVVLLHSKWRSHFMVVEDSVDIQIENVTVYDSAGMALINRRCENIVVDDFDIEPHLGRIISGSADGFKPMQCRGTFEMRNCDMSRHGDDGLNLHAWHLSVEYAAPNTNYPNNPEAQILLIQEPGGGTPDPVLLAGDQLHVYGPDLARKGEATIVGTVTGFGGQYSFTVIGQNIPLAVGDFVTNGSSFPDSILVEDCNISENFARGLVIKGKNADVKNCTFTRTTGPGLMLQTDVRNWYESGGTQTIFIENCVFDEVNTYAGSMRGALQITAENAQLNGTNFGPDLVAPSGVHQDITITGCEFKNLKNVKPKLKSAVYIASAKFVALGGLGFPGNTFTNIANGMCIVQSENTESVLIKDNSAPNWTSSLVPVPAQYQYNTNGFFQQNNSW